MINSDKVFCRGSESLKALILPLVKSGIIKITYSVSILDHSDKIFFPRKTGITWQDPEVITSLLNCGYKEITPEEFKALYITHEKVEPKKYIGFRVDSFVDFSLFPKEIIPSGFRFSVPKSNDTVIFYDHEIKKLNYATNQNWITTHVDVVKFIAFVEYLGCFLGTNTLIQSPIQMLDISEESTKPEKLKLSNINTLKIVL